MSTFDPQMEPPGDWQTSYEPPVPRLTQSAEKAAIFLWLSAGLQLLMSCCCGVSAIGLMVMGPDELLRQMPPDMPNREMMHDMVPILGPMIAIGSAVFLLIPAIILAVLAFKVRTGSKGAIIASLIILGIQTLGLGLITLFNLLNLVLTRTLTDLASVAILAGSVMVFSGTLVILIKALMEQNQNPPPQNQW